MKPPVSYAPPRRLVRKKRVKLDLRRATPPPDDDEVGSERKSGFWKWVGLVALFHALLIALVSMLYRGTPTPPPPQFEFSLLPPGDVVKGTPGIQGAPKLGPTTPAPSVHHTPPPPSEVTPPTPVAVKPPPMPTPKPIEPTPVIKSEAPPLVEDKPIKPPKPPKPQVKVDLKLVDGPAIAADKPVVKPKPHLKKPVNQAPPDKSDAPDRDASTPDNTGLSPAQVAAKLSQKLQAEGVADAVKIGPSGSAHSQANPYADFYLSIRDQVRDKWTSPNQDVDVAINPILNIHVEKDGRVPPESVTLIRSSGNTVYDESALEAARHIGYTLQPLPDGCPPDISITFKPNR